ncbi:hypothetical protein FJY71_03415 [candidate division WOR-3 bacterium]|nr:hypothetical protein [candidate division WOR-3 bacterium]
MRHVRHVLERFGIPEAALAGFEFEPAPAAVFVGTAEVMGFDAVRPLRRGLRFCRLYPHSVKPTSHAMQVFGREATRNRVAVDEEQAVVLANGGEVRIEAEAENGFVLICWREFVLGTGLYKRPALRSQIPRFRPVG